MQDQIFTSEQFIPVPRTEVFAFFATPKNLEAITPPWLRFRIVRQSTPEVQKDTELTYRLRVHGLPMTWKSLIEQWRPNERFVDVQLRGPYASWRHTHEFCDHDKGTMILDHVQYRLPMGRMGQRIAGRFVASDVRKIFDYRATRVEALLQP